MRVGKWRRRGERLEMNRETWDCKTQKSITNHTTQQFFGAHFGWRHDWGSERGGDERRIRVVGEWELLLEIVGGRLGKMEFGTKSNWNNRIETRIWKKREGITYFLKVEFLMSIGTIFVLLTVFFLLIVWHRSSFLGKDFYVAVEKETDSKKKLTHLLLENRKVQFKFRWDCNVGEKKRAAMANAATLD
jgi:hypothetical protein